MAWLLSLALMIGSLADAGLLVAADDPVLCYDPDVPAFGQKGILGAFDHLPTRVGELLSEVSESVMEPPSSARTASKSRWTTASSGRSAVATGRR